MKTYYVWQWLSRAIGRANDRRPVRVNPDWAKGDLKELLETIYVYGDNENQPLPNFTSVTCGDVIEVDDKNYVILAVGFLEVSPEEFDAYKQLNSADRIHFTFTKTRSI